MTIETETPNDREYRLACEMALEFDRVLDLCERIRERDYSASRWNEWEGMVERIIDEHIGDPLSIEWKGSTSSNPAYGDVEWDIDEIEVTLGTGGPARGVNFRNGYAYPWHQDWGTPKVESASPLGAGVDILAAHWGIEEF